ncbi:phage baseplate protein [Klebsiella oxytoca]|uniref:phage baseplate protein n=1 Tax=Klebsiella oxytoca TaxID=571 RepID=UPI001919827B|nr:hypothetical protein [Klebsiella oxytoca]HAT1590643.1 hypothetical protein [Klebsiella oxytoca]HBC9239938.1 hypothetical protein [Klebsiella oxytoca]HCD7233905.1 hypothetical protein [Klebsiella oxytoca]
MPITGLFTRNRPKIGNLYFDALLKEGSELRTDVSEYPLETAETSQDNAVTRALTLTLEVGVSDNWYRSMIAQEESGTAELVSLGGSLTTGVAASLLSGRAAALAGVAASIGISLYEGGSGDGAQTSRSQSLLDQLRQLQRSHIPFDVVASRGASYKNCLITNTRTETDKSTEGGLIIVVELLQLTITYDDAQKTNDNLPYKDSAATQGQVERSLGEVIVQGAKNVISYVTG